MGKVCSECGKAFVPKSPLQVTCGATKCKQARQTRRRAELDESVKGPQSFGLSFDPWGEKGLDIGSEAWNADPVLGF